MFDALDLKLEVDDGIVGFYQGTPTSLGLALPPAAAEKTDLEDWLLVEFHERH